ncbi:MAG: restriction endonuclease subunit S [Methylococcaceae bacterium]|nr:restriction endonuclease subunit S [Methylococcaceae bacterium]
MAKGNKIPEIRFKGFGGEWEEKELGRLCANTYGGGTPRTSEAKYWNGDIAWIQSSDITEEQLSNVVPRKSITENGLKASATKLIPENSIAIVTRVGVGKLAFMQYKYTTSQDFLSLSKLKIDNWYGAYSIWRKLQNEKLSVQGTSIKGITKEELLLKVIAVPKIEKEQTKIGTYFQQIDTLITLHQKKYDKLLNVKKAMLEKMFPKKSADVPEIRFKGFSDKWEERKLGELADYKNGKGHEDKQNTFGEYELINLNSISIDGGLKNSGKFVNETDTTLNKDDLVMVLSDVAHGNLLGRVALIPENNKFVLNQRVALLRPSNSVIPLFLFYNINAHQLYFKSQGAGMSQLNISKSNVEDFTSYIPNQEEQTKIGNFFKNLDNLITLHQIELEKLKNIKKACLEKMFV